MAMPRVRPLLGNTRRTWADMTLAACVIVVVLTGLLFKGETGPDGFDNVVDSTVIATLRAHGGFLPIVKSLTPRSGRRAENSGE